MGDLTPPGFERLLDAVPALIWTAQDDGSVDYVNARWAEYTGLPAEESFGWRWLSIVHPDDLERTSDVWEVAIAKRTALELQLRFRRHDGAFRWHLVRAIPVVPGERSRWIGSSFDIDRQKRVEQTLQFLASANEILSSTLDVRAALERLTDLTVPAVADFAVAHTNNGGRPALASAKGIDLAPLAALAASAGRVLLNATPTIARGGDELLTALGAREIAIFPMATGETTVIGTLSLGMRQSGRKFSGLDLQFAGLLANRAAMAIANAALFEREHRAADILQRTLLPSVLPKIEGVELEAFYEAAESRRNVGGDWYDAFVLDERRVLVGIGDVAGKGLAAAATMGRVRDSLRAAALCNPDPVRILEVADDTLLDDEHAFVTCFVGIFDRKKRTVSYACAGHHPPRLRRTDGTIVELLPSGLPLGLQWARREKRPAGKVKLEPGSLLVFFTDGLIEQTHDSIAESKRLDATIASLTGRGKAVALRDAFVATPSLDDVAILTLEVR